MCGIAGQFLLERKAQLAGIRSMCDEIRHRGPDDEGYHVDGGCGIGMRRLSIIDLNTGHQPICNEDESVWVVFNGEIYNYQELRADLIRRGHRFKTNSDTETLVHLYEEEGTEGIHKLRGMFAYAIWDSRQRSLLLVRDRFGKKPLYFGALDDGLRFGSELKCLQVAGVPLEIDRTALQLYFALNYVPDPWCIYRSVRKVMPGGWLRYHASGKLEEGLYWRLPVSAETAAPGFTEAEACKLLRDTFDESVRLRLISDVPLGAFLSGGIDSTSIVASMAMQTKEPVKTFSIGFEEPEFSELSLAASVAKQYNTDHHEIIVRPDSIDLVSKLVRHFDEPFADPSSIPTYLVSEFAVRYVKVALTGDGGDELFAGYDSFFDIERYRPMDRVPGAARKLLSFASEMLPYSAYGKNYLRMLSRPTALDRYFENDSPRFLMSRLLEPDWMPPGDAAFLLTETLAHCFPPNGADILTQALYFEATAKLTGNMLVKVDRMSMANSLEVRCPMLDHKLAELAAKIPHSWKLRNGRGKHIFIQALGDRLPPHLLRQPKRGFSVPLAIWFRGSLRNFLWDHLTSPSFLNRGIVSGEFVRHLLSEHDRGRRNNYYQLWKLLMLELWLQNFDQARATPPAAPAGALLSSKQ